jgi:uncharacterized Zn-finger protein
MNLAAQNVGNYVVAGHAARVAHTAAEAAFSHPAILAQLSFPESHKLGVSLQDARSYASDHLKCLLSFDAALSL